MAKLRSLLGQPFGQPSELETSAQHESLLKLDVDRYNRLATTKKR